MSQGEFAKSVLNLQIGIWNLDFESYNLKLKVYGLSRISITEKFPNKA